MVINFWTDSEPDHFLNRPSKIMQFVFIFGTKENWHKVRHLCEMCSDRATWAVAALPTNSLQFQFYSLELKQT